VRNSSTQNSLKPFPFLSQGFTSIFDKSPLGPYHDLGELHPEQVVQVEDSERFQQYIHNIQFQTDCTSSSTRIYKMTKHPYGLGSQIHIIAMSLLEAMVANMTFVMDWPTEYIASSRCKSQMWTCSFLELSGCTSLNFDAQKARQREECSSRKATITLKNFDESNCLAIERRQSRSGAFLSEWLPPEGIIPILRQRAGIRGNYGALFYLREAVRFVLRPNEGLKTFSQSLIDEIENLEAGTPLKNMIGVHIRHGEDKMARPQYDVPTFAEIIYQRLEAQGNFSHVFLASNSKKAYTDLQKELDRLEKTRGINFPSPKVVFVPARFFKTIGTGDKKQDPYSTLKGYDAAKGATYDEMMAMIASVFILAHTGTFMGTMHHNFGQIVYELMSARLFDLNPNALDISGAQWFSGWWAAGYPHAPLHPNPFFGRRRG